MTCIEFEAGTYGLHCTLYTCTFIIFWFASTAKIRFLLYDDQVHLPLTEFAAFFRGQQVEDAPPLDLTKVIVFDLILETSWISPDWSIWPPDFWWSVRRLQTVRRWLSWDRLHFPLLTFLGQLNHPFSSLNKSVPTSFAVALVEDSNCLESLRIFIKSHQVCMGVISDMNKWVALNNWVISGHFVQDVIRACHLGIREGVQWQVLPKSWHSLPKLSLSPSPPPFWQTDGFCDKK